MYRVLRNFSNHYNWSIHVQNTGNTFRDMYADPEFFSLVTGIPIDLFKNFVWIRTAVRCGRPLDPAKFKERTGIFKQLYTRYYPWAFMNPTLHKVVIHYHVLLELLPPTLTTNMLTEEGPEGM